MFEFCEIDFGWSTFEVKAQEKVQQGIAVGFRCCECQDFYPDAELNFPEDQKYKYRFKCFSCRRGLATIF